MNLNKLIFILNLVQFEHKAYYKFKMLIFFNILEIKFIFILIAKFKPY